MLIWHLLFNTARSKAYSLILGAQSKVYLPSHRVAPRVMPPTATLYDGDGSV